MGSLSNYAENVFINHLFNAAYTPVATVYLALLTSDPTAGDGGTIIEVANSGNYARTAISFGAAASRRITQDAICTFPLASGAWGTIQWWAIVDSATYGAGNVLATGTFSSSFSPVAGNTPSIASGQVWIEVTAASGYGLTNYAVHGMLGRIFDNQAFATKAGSTFAALINTQASDTIVSTSGLTEVSGTAYARVEVNENGGSSPKWGSSTTGSTTNDTNVVFPTVGAGGWTQVVGAIICDATSGVANIIAYDNVNVTDQTPATNDVVRFLASAMTVSIS